jgi:ABC-type phosphate/phosphonate transport system substrate-binding protein
VSSSIATLPMYDLPELHHATSELLGQITKALSIAGWPMTPAVRDFADHAALVDHWRDSDVALSHSCGLPYLEELAGHAQVLGTFQWRGVSDERGHYRSVVVVRHDDPRTIEQLRGAQPIINSPESLSGWCSLGAALHQLGYSANDFPPWIASGAHSKSIELVASGVGDFAAIDGATLRLLERHRPGAVAGIRPIGLGPRIPGTPLITRADPELALEKIQSALLAAIADPSLAGVRDLLGIERFVPLDHDDYAPISLLVTEASATLPRKRRST